MQKTGNCFVVLLIFCLLYQTTVAKITCKNEQGHEVDWFYMYKLPKHYENGSGKAQKTSGLSYLYVTSENYDEGWKMSETNINASDSLTAQTLEGIFQASNLLTLAYNDEFPNGTTKSGGGHTKGVVATDGTTGFWLIHSVPKFPETEAYSYPSTGSNYGQSLLCISLAAEEMRKVGTQLLYNEPNVYFSHMPEEMSGKFPEFERVVLKKWLRATPYFNKLEIKSLGERSFQSFAKSGKYGKDLYEDLVAPELDVNLLVETWRKGTGNLASNCTQNDKVLNIEELELKDLHISFKTTADHSKWAVSQASGIKLWRWRIGGVDWLCVGDINRQVHQYERGGGTLCQKNMKLAELYRNLITQYEPCTRKSKLIN